MCMSDGIVEISAIVWAILMIILIIPSQLNYYSMETEFAAEKLVFSKSFFAASNVVSILCLVTCIINGSGCEINIKNLKTAPV